MSHETVRGMSWYRWSDSVNWCLAKG